MHREQQKCKLRRRNAMNGQAAGPDEDFSKFSANLHSAKLNLLPHMVFTAVLDACRGVKGDAKSSASPSASASASWSAAAATRATRR